MSPGRIYLRRIWSAVAHTYHDLVWSLGLGGHSPDADWHAFQHQFGEYLGWVDLLSASALRFRATKRRTELPKTAEAHKPTLFASIAPPLEEIAMENHWFAEHRRITDPLVKARAEWVRITEQEYLWNRQHTIQQLLKEPENRKEFTPLHRLEMRRRTTHNEIQNLSEQVQLSHPEIGSAFTHAEYLSRDDARVRPTHRAMHGFIASRSWHGWPLCVPPCSFNCFLPGTMTEGAFTSGFKAWYDGPAIELEVSGGKRLSVTANHPIFTPNGWIAAGSLKEGDALLCDRRMIQGIRSGANDEENAPAPIEDVFNALRSRGVAGNIPACVESSYLDFYGDPRFFVGQVDVVGSARELLCNREAELANFISQDEFVSAGSRQPHMVSASALSLPFQRILASTATDPSSAALADNGPAVLFEAGPFQGLCLTSASDLNAVGNQEFVHRSAFAPQFVGQGFQGHSALIFGNQFGGVPPIPLRYGSASKWNVGAFESKAERHGAHAEFSSDLRKVSAGRISLDRVLKIKRFAYSGHVYDLESETGWILAQGIVASNCRCFIRLISRHEAREAGWLLPHTDRPAFELRWPNSLAEENWRVGRFPEFKTPRYWAFPGKQGEAVAA